MQARKGHPASAKAPRPADHGDTEKRRGRERMAAAAPRNMQCLCGLRAAAAVAPAGQEAPAPQRLRISQGVPPNTRQQWAEAYTVIGHKIFDVCANAQGASARAEVVQGVQEFGALARTGFVYSRSRRSDAAVAARATRISDGLPLEVAGGEEDSERTAGLRCPHLSDAQRQAARIERCLHQKRTVHRAAQALQDSKPADARDPGVRTSLHAAHPVAAPAAALEAAKPALQLTQEQLQEVVGIVSAHHMISGDGCRAIGLGVRDNLRSLPIIRCCPRRHPLARRSYSVRGASAGGLSAGRALDRAREARRRHAAHRDQRDVVSLCRGLRAADVRAGHRRTIGPASGGGRHTSGRRTR